MKWSRLQAGQVITSYSVSGPSSSSSSKMCSTFKLVFGQVKMNAILQTTSDCVREPGQERTVLVPDGEQRMIAAAPAAAKNQKKERPVKTAPSRLMGNQALKGFAHQIGRSGLSNPFARRPSCECTPFFCDPAPCVGRCGGKCVNKIPCDAKPSHCIPLHGPGATRDRLIIANSDRICANENRDDGCPIWTDNKLMQRRFSTRFAASLQVHRPRQPGRRPLTHHFNPT